MVVDRHDLLPRLARRRAAARRLDRGGARPGRRGLGPADPRVRARGRHRRRAQAPGPARGQGRDRRLSLARRAATRRRRGRRSTRSPQRAQAAGLRTHWGRKVLEVRPPVKIDKGAGITSFLNEAGAGIDSALYVGDDTTDLDAFRALASWSSEGELDPGGPGRGGIRGGAVGDHRRGRPRRRRARGRATSCSRCWSPTEPGALLGLPAHDGPDQRRGGERAGGDHAGRGAPIRATAWWSRWRPAGG